MAHPSWWSVMVEPGAVLDLAADEYEFGDGRPMRLRVIRVLDRLSENFGGEKVRIEGVRLDHTGLPVENLQVLVLTSAL
jgi:hypothetical protein